MAFDVKFSEMSQTFGSAFTPTGGSFDSEFGKVHEVIVPADTMKYEGAYEVTPKVEGQSLPTAQRFLEEDVEVKAIPFFKTSNTSGGATVYIGNEV